VFIDSDEERTGISFAVPGSEAAIHGMVESTLIGRDPRGVKGLWSKLIDLTFKGGNRGVATAAISAIDVALWDLKAKLNDEPLWKTLGASNRLVKAYASGIDSNLSDEELRAYYERMAKKGVSGGKLKVGLDREADLRRIGIMKAALETSGKKPMLMIDSNEYWSPKQAIRHIRYLEREYDITWAEEPARRWDYRGLRKVSNGVRAAVATGENLDDISDYMPLMLNEAVDVVQISARTSGITGCLQVADMAYGFNLPVSMINCAANFMGHVAAVMPNHMTMEVVAGGRDAVLTVDNTIEDGWIRLGDAPGLGIEFDAEKLAKARVDRPSVVSGWGRRRGAGLYEVPPDEPDTLESE
jgi:L-alanine-DL-glutamate epimerase-like enolase superfamily enzyme